MMFGFSGGNSNNEDVSAPQVGSNKYVQTPYLNIDPTYLSGADDYILMEDNGPVRSRVQTMFAMIGTACVSGAGVGTMQSLRYSGLQLLKGGAERKLATSAVLKNGASLSQKFGAASFLYCACGIISEKSRGVEDDWNNVIGGGVAGVLYSLPGVLNVKKHGPEVEEETIGFIRRSLRRLPPVGRLVFGLGAGAVFGGLVSLYKTEASDYVKQITSRT